MVCHGQRNSFYNAEYGSTDAKRIVMKKTVALTGSLLVLYLVQILVSKFSLTIYHPFWNIKATLIGGAIGLAILVIIYLLEIRYPAASRLLFTLVGILLVISIAITWNYASIFVNSADFEALAGKVWFFGYIVTMAMLVPVAGLTIGRLMPGK